MTDFETRIAHAFDRWPAHRRGNPRPILIAAVMASTDPETALESIESGIANYLRSRGAKEYCMSALTFLRDGHWMAWAGEGGEVALKAEAAELLARSKAAAKQSAWDTI